MSSYAISASSVCTLLQRNGKHVPPSGSIVDLGTRETVRVYVYKFNAVTRCSDACKDDLQFQCCFPKASKPIDVPVGLSRHVAWSFYSLNCHINHDLKKEFESPEKRQLKPRYTYRRPSTENERVEALHCTIHGYFNLKDNLDIDLRRIVTPGITDHYCQFTGGGDIYLEKLTESLVIYSGPESSPTEDTETVSGLIIETKKVDCSDESLRCQLFANTILTCITTFLNKCKEKKCNAAFIKDVKQISGYGVAYTGMGCVGFYKLQIKFDEVMEFEEKIPLAQYRQPDSAAIVDFAIDYFMGKI